MEFTVIAYTESQDSAVLVPIAAVADSHVTVAGDDIYVPALAKLGGYWFGGASTTLAQIESPSLRDQGCLIDVSAHDLADEPVTPAAMHKLFHNPIDLHETEALRTLAAEGGAGAVRTNAVLFLCRSPAEPVKGREFTIRATNASTLVADNWTNGALTLTQTLPAGDYAIVGMKAWSAGLRAARLVIPGYPWRPGCLGGDLCSDRDEPIFRHGKLGTWGRFKHNTPPTVDFFSASADTSQVVFLDLIKIA